VLLFCSSSQEAGACWLRCSKVSVQPVSDGNVFVPATMRFLLRLSQLNSLVSLAPYSSHCVCARVKTCFSVFSFKN
jgi:hypothetical protein